MLTFNKLFCLIFFTAGLCEGYIIADDKFQKCSLKDTECLIKASESIILKVKEGIPELGIPPMDPYIVENTTVPILGMVELTMVKGKVEGTTDCRFTKFDMDVDNRIANTESFCEQIIVAGQYKIVPGPFIKALTGNSVSGEGNGQIKIDKMTLKMKIPYDFKKRSEDGEIFIIPRTGEAEYSTENIENISFEADRVSFGNQEVSQQLIGFMNKNWKTILRSFGKFFSDKIMEVFYYYLKKFFLDVAAKYYISDDLSSYV